MAKLFCAIGYMIYFWDRQQHHQPSSLKKICKTEKFCNSLAQKIETWLLIPIKCKKKIFVLFFPWSFVFSSALRKWPNDYRIFLLKIKKFIVYQLNIFSRLNGIYCLERKSLAVAHCLHWDWHSFRWYIFKFYNICQTDDQQPFRFTSIGNKYLWKTTKSFSS